MIYGESPGSVKNQIGRSLIAIRDSLMFRDIAGVADQTRLLAALASPFLAKEEEETRRACRVSYGMEEEEEVVFGRCIAALEVLLPVLARHGIYAYVAGDPGDASSIALTDVDDASRENQDDS